MYTKNDLRDINYERARIICDAITELKRRVVPGTPYTARELAAMTEWRIPASNFEDSLRRGYHALKRREDKKAVAGFENKYMLFGDWRAECDIHREGSRLITIKEYDEEGNLISERQKRRGRPYFTATF